MSMSTKYTSGSGKNSHFSVEKPQATYFDVDANTNKVLAIQSLILDYLLFYEIS